MRIFGDPSDATFDEDDFVFSGMSPLVFDLAFTASTRVGPFAVQAAEVFVPGAVIGEVFIPGAVIGEAFIPGAVAAEVF